MTSDWASTLKLSKVPCTHWILTPNAQTFIHFALQPAVLEIQGCEILEMHQMTPEWPCTLNCHKHPVYTEYLSLKPNFWSILLCSQPFWRYKVAKNRKCIEWPRNDLENLTVKKCPVYTKLIPRGQNFHPFRSMTSRFRDIRLLKIGNALNDLEHLPVKSTLYTPCTLSYLPPRPKCSLVHLALWPAVSRYIGHVGWRVENRNYTVHWMTSDWPWTLSCQKYTLYTCTLNTCPKNQILLSFILRWVLFMIHVTSVLGNSEHKISGKKKCLKIGNSKFQKSKTVLLWRPLRRKFRRC